MNIDRAVLAFAALMVLLSVTLTVWVSPWFAWLTVFVGLNMLQASVSGACPAAWAFRKLGVRPGAVF